jgi:hypothetical protein
LVRPTGARRKKKQKKKKRRKKKSFGKDTVWPCQLQTVLSNDVCKSVEPKVMFENVFVSVIVWSEINLMTSESFALVDKEATVSAPNKGLALIASDSSFIEFSVSGAFPITSCIVHNGQCFLMTNS